MPLSDLYSATYLDTYGESVVTFPQAPLGAKVELQLAGTWTDVSTYVLQREGTSPPISITRGRPDESAQVNPSAAAMQLNNRDGRFSVLNATGPYYGQLSRNTPVRISVPGSGVYLRMEADQASAAACADASALRITGDIDIRLDVHIKGFAGNVLASKWNTSAANGFAWALSLTTTGCLQFSWSDSGTDTNTATSVLPVTTGRQCVRVTLQVNNGSGGCTATFYTGAAGGADGSSWTQLGPTVVQSFTTSIYAATVQLAVGNYDPAVTVSNGINGSYYEFELRSGIAGTVVAHPVFSSQSAGATSFADAQSNTWTLSGTAQLSNRSYRYHGEMSSLPVTWDTSGTDVWVPVTAGGLLRRIGQGNAPLDSAMKRATRAQSGTLAVVAYWPCEDLAGASVIGSAIGGPAMTYSGGTGNGSTTTTGPGFAADSSFLCSLSLPQVNGSEWIGQVPAYASNGSIVVRFLMNMQTTPASGTVVMRVITTGTCTEVSLAYNGLSGSLLEFFIAGYNASGTVFNSGIYAVTGLTASEPVWVSIELVPGGGSTVNVAAVFLQPGQLLGQAINTSYTGTIGNVATCIVNPSGAMTTVTIGHISVQSAWQSLFNLYNPLYAWQGELAGNRFARLCSENGFASRIYGPPGTTVAMGAQSPNTLTSLLQECEEADHGQIFEPRQALALGYRPLAAITGQPAANGQGPVVTISYSAAELAGADVEPTYDDQFTRNDVSVQRSSGSVSGSDYRYELNDGSAMSISAPPNGVGDYSDSKSVNVQFDTQIPDQAGWLVHIGTVNEARWPMLPLDMVRPAVSGIFYTILGADIGDFAEVTNPPAWLPPDPVKQIILGTKEDLGGFHYKIAWQAIPESVYEVAFFDDATYGRADTDGSTLHANFSAGATSITVDTTNAASPLWSTAGADVPFDINVAGERITVTAVSGSSSPQTFTVTRAVNGVSKAQTAGADVRLWFPPILALI